VYDTHRPIEDRRTSAKLKVGRDLILATGRNGKIICPIALKHLRELPKPHEAAPRESREFRVARERVGAQTGVNDQTLLELGSELLLTRDCRLDQREGWLKAELSLSRNITAARLVVGSGVGRLPNNVSQYLTAGLVCACA